MTEPTEPRDLPAAEVPFEDAGFEVETAAMPDGRQVHYYRWPEHDPPRLDDQPAADV
jgi:hypothetical protein